MNGAVSLCEKSIRGVVFSLKILTLPIFLKKKLHPPKNSFARFSEMATINLSYVVNFVFYCSDVLIV
jgi:hypothetical protein